MCLFRWRGATVEVPDRIEMRAWCSSPRTFGSLLPSVAVKRAFDASKRSKFASVFESCHDPDTGFTAMLKRIVPT
jgi:hypothetical protein